MALLINVLCPGPPRHQPVGDLRVAQWAIFLGFVNGLVLPAYMQSCRCDGGYDNETKQWEMYYQLGNFVAAMLGMALLVVDKAFSTAALRLPPPVVKWMVWLAKVLTGALSSLALMSCIAALIRILCARVILAFTT